MIFKNKLASIITSLCVVYTLFFLAITMFLIFSEPSIILFTFVLFSILTAPFVLFFGVLPSILSELLTRKVTNNVTRRIYSFLAHNVFSIFFVTINTLWGLIDFRSSELKSIAIVLVLANVFWVTDEILRRRRKLKATSDNEMLLIKKLKIDIFKQKIK